MKYIEAGYNWHYYAPHNVEHKKDETESLLYLFHTPAVLVLFGKRQTVDRGNIVILSKGTAHSIIAPADLATTDYFMIDWVTFTMEGGDRDILRSTPFDQVAEIRQPELISNMIMNCCLMKLDKGESESYALTQLLYAMFACIGALWQDAEELHSLKQKYPEIVQLHRKIFEEPQQDWNLDRMCRMTHFSVSLLEKLYKQFYGVSCVDDVITSRLTFAKHLLITTNETIAEVAEKSGFHSYNHFARTFKKEIGHSPLEFRREYNQY